VTISRIGLVELNHHCVGFSQGGMGELLIDADIHEGDILVTYTFKDEEITRFDVYVMREVKARASLIWSKHEGHEVSVHEQKALADVLKPRGGKRDAQ
jgi:hypothetical protein